MREINSYIGNLAISLVLFTNRIIQFAKHLQPRAQRDYLHNNANQRTEVTEDNGCKWSLDYDSLEQVVKAEKLESSGEEVLPGFDFGYTFDDIGNRVPFKLWICSACQGLTKIRKKRLEDAIDDIFGRIGELDEPQTTGCDRLPACGERDTQRTIREERR